MDFKQRHPNLTRWPRLSFRKLEERFPYNNLMRGCFHHLEAFDGSTSFLLLFGTLSADESEACVYGIESRPDDEIRQHFENGDVFWSDFFDHKNWFIEFKLKLYTDDDLPVCYRPSFQLDQSIRNELTKLDGEGGPYQILHDQYLRSWEWGKQNFPREVGERRDRYLEFIKKWGNYCKLPKKAA